MTHNDIYTKFMIEYDKANVTSSYPSLTEYEVATVLDKAYNALISQKVTGNNVRRVALEGDLKSITDLSKLVRSADLDLSTADYIATNAVKADVPEDMLYFMQGFLYYDKDDDTNKMYPTPYNPLDGYTVRKLPVKLLNHELAQNFFSTAYNMPWVKQPVSYIENDEIITVYDPINTPLIEKLNGPRRANVIAKTGVDNSGKFQVVYIKTPNKFAKDTSDATISKLFTDAEQTRPADLKVGYFDYSSKTNQTAADNALSESYTFECNDTVAEELISLAIAFALENVESQRLNSKLNMRGLEA